MRGRAREYRLEAYATVEPASVIPSTLIRRGLPPISRLFVQVGLEILRRSFFRVLN